MRLTTTNLDAGLDAIPLNTTTQAKRREKAHKVFASELAENGRTPIYALRTAFEAALNEGKPLANSPEKLKSAMKGAGIARSERARVAAKATTKVIAQIPQNVKRIPHPTFSPRTSPAKTKVVKHKKDPDVVTMASPARTSRVWGIVGGIAIGFFAFGVFSVIGGIFGQKMAVGVGLNAGTGQIVWSVLSFLAAIAVGIIAGTLISRRTFASEADKVNRKSHSHTKTA